jgi:hypothetical protein
MLYAIICIYIIIYISLSRYGAWCPKRIGFTLKKYRYRIWPCGHGLREFLPGLPTRQFKGRESSSGSISSLDGVIHQQTWADLTGI